MQKLKYVLLSSISGLLIMLAISSASAESSYAEERALIVDLQGRYMFAINFGANAETFASLFSKDAIFDVAEGVVFNGRDAIMKSHIKRAKKTEARQAKDLSGLPPANHRHHLTTTILKIDGDKAVGQSYWFHAGNSNPERKPVFMTHGHYDDEFVKENGKWLISYRKIYHD